MNRLKLLLIYAVAGAAIYFLVPVVVNVFLRAYPSVFIDDEIEVGRQTVIDCLTFTSDRDMSVSIAASGSVSLVVYKPQSISDASLKQAHLDFLNCSENALACRFRANWPASDASQMAVLGGYHPDIRNQSFEFEVDEDEQVCVMLFNEGADTITASRLVETTPR